MNTAVTATPAAKSSLPGVNVLLMGPAGTGKTHVIGTLVDAGVEVFYFAYEAGTESLFGYWTDRGLPIPTNLHTCTVKAASASFLEMADSVNKVNVLSYDTLKKMADPNKSKYNQLETFLRSFNDVRPDGEDKSYGSVQTWGPDRALVIDGLSGLGDSAMKAVIGGKFDRDQKDWGLAQNILEGILRKLTGETQCHFILIAHVERETDMVLGGVKLMVSTLGRALAPKIPAMFSDVILTARTGTSWVWDTASAIADVKTRNLPISDKIQPTFATILDKWKSRGGAIKA